jgi:hypothetical protein
MKDTNTRQFLAPNQQQTGNSTFRCYQALAVLCLLSILPASAMARPKFSLIVRVFNYAQVPSATISSAERDANNILASAGVQAVWLDCLAKPLVRDSKALCDKGWSQELPAVRLLSGQVTKQFQDFEFGFAAVPILVTVSYDHIILRAARDNSPSEIGAILGCVLAHELGHLLLRSNSHSAAGIMQPQWGREQIRQALMGGMLFSSEQCKRIGKELEMRTKLRTIPNVDQPVAMVDAQQ